MDLVAAALLGVVQGLTEFLPVSSSGHLILARAISGWDPGRFGLAFDVACHVGTLLAVVAYFRADILRLTLAAPAALSGRDGSFERLGRLIVAGTLPVVVVGLLYADAIETTLRSPRVVIVALAVGAIGLLAAEWLGRQRRDEGSIGYGEAVLIGIAQSAALVPGVSRSGATLTAAMLLGLRRESAARFIFLLSLPAVLAAALKEGLELWKAGLTGLPVDVFAVGLVVSGLVGYVTVKYFIRFLAGHTLVGFAVYRLVLAAAGAIWLAGSGAGL
ncbi:MAG: undecaprenyl-diphosphatase UppP [Vicinamibacterales bacterium]